MINIPAEEINARSPYEVIPMGTNSFVFITNYGLKYNVGFSETYMLTDDDGMYEFYITNVEHKHSPNDPLVFETIKVIIEVFFQQAPVVMLYICDPSDSRQEQRSRLYKIWFESYSNRDAFTLADMTIDFEGQIVYGGLLIRKNHPAYIEILEAFNDFVHLVPYDTSIADK